MNDITHAASWTEAKAARDQVRSLLARKAPAVEVARAKDRYKALALKCHREVGNL